MKVYLLKDVEGVGLAGQIVKVSDGYGMNFLIPRKIAKVVAENDEVFLAKKAVKIKADAQAMQSKMGILAERIKNLHLVVKERIHNDGKLYGSVGADEVVALLKEKEIQINRKQVEFKKAIRSVGEHSVVIRLSSKLQPELTIKVVSREG